MAAGFGFGEGAADGREGEEPAHAGRHGRRELTKEKLEASIAYANYANGTTAAIAPVMEALCMRAIEARLLRVLILYPGPDHPESLASVLRGRGHHAERYEYLDDPVRQDLEDVDLQAQIIGSVEQGEWDAVVLQTPCSSFSVAQEPAIRTLGEPGGTAEAIHVQDWVNGSAHLTRRQLTRGAHTHAQVPVPLS